MKTSFHRFLTKDSIELVGLLYEPEAPTKKILVHVHGMAGNFYENNFLDFIAETLTANGIALLTFNNSGCELMKDLTKVENGKRTIVRIGGAYEKFEDSVQDIQAAIDFVESKGFLEINLSGHSLGAPKVAYYLSLQSDTRIKSGMFLSPADMVGLAKADKNYKRDITTAKEMIVTGKGSELLPFTVLEDSYLSADTYMSITNESSSVAIFNLYNSGDALVTLGKITVPILTVIGRKDGALTVGADEMMERVKKAMTGSTRVETNILGDADHGYNSYGQELADVLKDWILKI